MKKQVMIENKRHALPVGVTAENKRGKQCLVATIRENGTRRRVAFPFTLEGLRQAAALVNTARREARLYGAAFGSISDDEKRALELWREYRAACERERCPYVKASEVMAAALVRMRDEGISPKVEDIAAKYLENVTRKASGENTYHVATVKGRLARICAAMGKVRICHVTESRIVDFLESLRHPRTGKKAQPNTRKHYLALIKGMFRFAVGRGWMEDGQDVARHIEPPQIRRKEPGTLTVAEVRKVLRCAAENPELHPFIPALAVGFFCGARLAERARMKYADTDVKGQVFLSCEITKTSIDRYIRPARVFYEWLDFARAHGVDTRPDAFIIPGITEKKRREAHNYLLRRLRRMSGVNIPVNGIRHSAATYMTAERGLTATAEQMGHSEGMLARHYRHAVTRGEAAAYFSLSPAACMSDAPLRISEPAPLPAAYPVS